MEGLSEREKRFCEEYLADFNATKAVLRAGIDIAANSAATLGWQLLRKTEIQDYIANLKKERAIRTQIDADRLIHEALRLAHFDPADFLNPDGSLKKPSEWPESQAIAGFEMVEYFEGSGKDREQVGWTKKLKFADRMKALEYLARILGLDARFKWEKKEAKRKQLEDDDYKKVKEFLDSDGTRPAGDSPPAG